MDDKAEAFRIVKSILVPKIKPDRITYRDINSYFVIVLDNNSRKTICRLYLGKYKYIGTINDKKVETKTAIEGVQDILKFSEELVNTVAIYDNR